MHRRLDTLIKNETVNLLDNMSMGAAFFTRVMPAIKQLGDDLQYSEEIIIACSCLVVFCISVCVYMEDQDLHDDYILNELYFSSSQKLPLRSQVRLINNYDSVFSFIEERNIVKKDKFDLFASQVKQLERFLVIFKSELRGVDIDKVENDDEFVCRLIMKLRSPAATFNL